jgi:hypothetical protein
MQQTLDELDFDRGLWGACSRGDLDRVTELLDERKRDPNERDLSGYTPLHYAARLGHGQVCSLLLRKKADVDPLAGESAATPLHRACGASHIEVSRHCCGQLARRHVVIGARRFVLTTIYRLICVIRSPSSCSSMGRVQPCR